MGAKDPHIAAFRHRVFLRLRCFILVTVGGFRRGCKQFVKLLIRKSRQFEINPRILQVTQFKGQHFVIPPGVKRKAVIRENVGSFLCFGEIFQLNTRDFGKPEFSRRQRPPMPGNDTVFAIDDDRVCPAEFFDRGGNPCHLFVGMRAGVSSVRDKVFDLAVRDFELVSHGENSEE
jgi:hypothetical protein